ncbi:MAG: helix-turn-helix domain-containing protein, partial [Caldilineaceae bacterium]|nr:helix-turn-helix domain-containing protein [Caldilineaceae bacterium]
DGLQLSKIVRKQLPAAKIIILSGHDEFQYAQEAVKLGVTEYLLKPIGVKALQEVLQKVADQIQQERQEKAHLQTLKAQVADNRAVVQDQFLLRLVTGSFSVAEAIEQSQRLEVEIVAPFYVVLVIKFSLSNPTERFVYHAYQQVRRMIAGLLANTPEIFVVKKDLEELVLILKGQQADALAQEASAWAGFISNEVAQKSECRLTVGRGQIKNRLGDLPASFSEAQANLLDETPYQPVSAFSRADKDELLQLVKAALENFLAFGQRTEFDAFFDLYLRPLSQAVLGSYLIKNYIYVELVLTAARFVHQLGGDVDQIIPEINAIETHLLHMTAMSAVKGETQKIFAAALAFRDAQNQLISVINRAKEFVNRHFSDADLSLTEVAQQVNLSSSYLSALFSQETGQTFKEYLTAVRIDQAKVLLSTTTLKSVEIAERVGYNDPHYFSTVFKKSTGLSPRRFRLRLKGPGLTHVAG